MVNEWEEYLAYTTAPRYIACTDGKKKSTSYLGRFTYKTLLDLEGMERILTIIARGYLFHDRDGGILDGDPYGRTDKAYRALCAWCSIPERKNAPPKKAGQARTDYRDYHDEFPELVSDKGAGWFYSHVQGIIRFVRNHPEVVRQSDIASCEKLAQKFDKFWRDRSVHYQVSLYSPGTKAAWGIRFDGIIADALELGALRNTEPNVSPELMERLNTELPKGVPADVVALLIAYYEANKSDDSDWAVLPVANFDAYFSSTTFSRRYLAQIPETVIQRDTEKLGVCRFRVTEGMITLLSL